MADRVSFLVAGVQKGGTSALRHHLRRVPALNVPEGEPHFFDNARLARSPAGQAAYAALFAGGEGLRGEVTPNYCYWPGAMERAAAYNPEMRIVMLLRDRVERAWSQWRMHARKGQEAEPFGWAIREGRGREAGGPGTRGGAHRVFSYVERGFYAPQVARLLKLFGPEQLLLLHSTDLRDDPAATMTRIGDFLGVAIGGRALDARRINVGSEDVAGARLDPADVAYLRALYAEDERTLTAMTGFTIPHADLAG